MSSRPAHAEAGNHFGPGFDPHRAKGGGAAAGSVSDQGLIASRRSDALNSSVSDGITPIVCRVDDDASVRKSIARLLESAGYQVDAFSEAQAFLEHLAHHSVPLAVLDIWMERMTGMELLAHLCARSPRTRLIFITGHEDVAAKSVVMRAGAFAFFLKPVITQEFLSAVERAFNGASQRPADIITKG